MNEYRICMQQMIKRSLWVLLLATGLQSSWAFSLGGPIGNGGDSWQTATIGYGLTGDLNAPKNIGQGYRRNVPVEYYAFDANFIGYFQEEGASAVDGAFDILNSVTNVDSYSDALTEFSTETRHQNYQAQALGLFDLKSWTLALMTEQLGLADPIRYSWTLHARDHVGTVACPVGMEYWVVQRNFSESSTPLDELVYSPYINNVLYSYVIEEFCTPTLPPDAITAPFSVDPYEATYSPVATPNLTWGDYYSGLTRDDVAGLRYLLSTNNIDWETPSADSTEILSLTNWTTQELFPVATGTNNGYLFNGVYYGTGSLNALLSFASTNDPALVPVAFPGVQANLVTSYFTNITVTNIVSYYTNYIGSPIGSPPVLVTVTNTSQGIAEYYIDQFPNIIINTNSYSSNTVYQLQTITVGPQPGAPVGSPSQTNIVTKLVTNNVPSGDFYILPTNAPCGVDILSTILTFTNYTTNIITSAITTNSTSTNAVFASEQIQVIPSVSHIFNIHPIDCEESVGLPALYEGVGHIQFVRADYDSTLSQYWQPITNNYTLVMITNSQAINVKMQRVVTQPDYVFSASDILIPGPGGGPVNFDYTRNVNFDQANILPGLAGPGTITSPSTITFNDVGPVYFNGTGFGLDGTPYFTENPGDDISGDAFYDYYYVWASYDGTTNAPTVYPNGTSMQNLINQILIQVSPSTLPNGYTGGYEYSQQIMATGGSFTKPYTWSATGLPPGLSITSNSDSTATISGYPTAAGTYDFVLTLTDYVGRTVQWTYTITIQQ